MRPLLACSIHSPDGTRVEAVLQEYRALHQAIITHASCRLREARIWGACVGLPHAQRVRRGRQPCAVWLGQGRRGDAPAAWGGLPGGPGHGLALARTAGSSCPLHPALMDTAVLPRLPCSAMDSEAAAQGFSKDARLGPLCHPKTRNLRCHLEGAHVQLMSVAGGSVYWRAAQS